MYFMSLKFFIYLMLFIGFLFFMCWMFFICWMLFIGWMFFIGSRFFMCWMLFVIFIGLTLFVRWMFLRTWILSIHLRLHKHFCWIHFQVKLISWCWIWQYLKNNNQLLFQILAILWALDKNIHESLTVHQLLLFLCQWSKKWTTKEMTNPFSTNTLFTLWKGFSVFRGCS